MRNERAATGVLDTCRGVGCAKLSLHKLCRRLEKGDAQMPRGALSVASLLPPLETEFRGRGIDSRVLGFHFRKYMHIHAKYVHIYIVYIILHFQNNRTSLKLAY